MNITDALQSDVSELVSLINFAYRPVGPTPGWTDERHLLAGPRVDAQMVAQDCTTNRYLVMRLRSAGPIVACARISIEHDGAWYLASIAVSPDQQARGLGAALLREIEWQAWQSCVPRLRMTVIALRVMLIAWYERHGFRRTGTMMAFPYDDPRVGRPLRVDLSLVVLEKELEATTSDSKE